MKNISIFFTSLLTCVLLGYGNLKAQNCSVNAGIDKTICPGSDFELIGTSSSTLPLKGAAVWTQVAGPAVSLSTTTNSGNTATAQVKNFVKGVTYKFRLTAQCADGATVFQEVSYSVSDVSIANAGADKMVCPGQSISLQGSPLGSGEVGRWTKISGGGNLPAPVDPTSPTSVLSVPSSGNVETATYRWTVTKGDCISYDDVVITNMGGAAVNAGEDVLNLACYNISTGTTLAGSVAPLDVLKGYGGTWSLVSGPSMPVFANNRQHNTGVSNLVEGTYILRWTVVGACFNGSDEMTITVAKASQDVTNAGAGSVIYCDGRTSVVLTGPKASYAGEIVTWSQTGGPAGTNILTPNSNVTIVDGLNPAPGNSYVFKFFIRNPLTDCESTGEYKVHFNAAPAVNIATASPFLAACGETEVTLNYSVVGGTSTDFAVVSAPAGSILETSMGGINNFVSAIASGQVIDGFNKIGTYIIRYRRSTNNTVGGCSDAYQDITIVISGDATASNAGTKQILACNVVETSLAGNMPAKGNGKWSQVNGPNTAFIDDVLNPTAKVTDLTNGVYTFRWIISGGDGGCSNTQQDVDVVVSSVIPVTSAAGNSKTTCFGTPVSLEGSQPLADETGTWTVLKDEAAAPEIVFSDIHDPKATVTGLASNSDYTFTWTVANACNSANSSVVIKTTNTIGPKQADAGADQCIPAPANSFTLIGNAPGQGEAGTWTLLSGQVGVVFTASQYNTTVTGVTAGTYVFEWSLSNGPCVVTKDEVQITISDPVTPANAGPDQYVCGNTAVLDANDPLIGQGFWTQTEGAGGAVIADPAAFNTTVSGLVDGRYKFTWKITNGACATPNADEVVINISSASTIANAGADQTLCNATSTTLDGNVITNGTGRWATVSGPTVPVFANLTNPATSVSNLAYGVYELEWISTGGLYCPSSSDKMTITVTQNAYAGVSQSLCDVNSVTLSGNPNSTGIWSIVTQPGGAIVATLAQVQNNGAIVTNMTSGVYLFRYTIAATGSCPATNSDVTYTISAPPTTANAGVDQAICATDPIIPTVQLAANQAVEGTGTWYISEHPTGATGSFSNINDKDATFTPSAEGVYILKWEINNGNCAGAKASNDFVRITISLPPTTANAGANQNNMCSDNITLSGNSPIFGLGTWTIKNISAGASTPVISQPNAPVTAVTGTSPGTYVFVWTIRNGVCVESSDEVTVVVSSIPPNKANAGADTEVCAPSIGGSASYTLAGNQPTGSETGTWSIISPAGATAAFANANLYNTSITGLKAGTHILRWTLDNGSCSSFDEVTIIVVNPPSVANITSADQTVCLYNSITLTAAAVTSGVGTWSVSAKPADATDPAFENVNGISTEVFGLVDGVYEFLFTTTNGVCASSVSAPVKVTVLAPPTPSVAGINQVTCLNVAIGLNANNPTTGMGTWSVTSGQPITDFEFSNPSSLTSTFTGKVVGTYTLAWTISNGICTSVSTKDVQVSPELLAADITATSNKICDGETMVLTGSNPTGGTGQYTYQWQRAVDGNPFANISATGRNYTTPVLKNTTAAPILYKYRRIVRSGNCSEVISNELIITVNPVINANAASVAIKSPICFEGATGVIIGGVATGGTGVYSYQWQRALNAGAFANIGAATDVNYDPGVLINNGTEIEIYKYRRIVSSDGCSVTGGEVNITVNPKPTLTSLLTASICSNDLFSHTPTANVGGTSFIWTRAAIAGISNVAATGAGKIEETLINTTNSPKQVTYKITLSANGCQNPFVYELVVSVNPSPIGTNAQVNVSDCDGAFTYNLQDNINQITVVPASFSWSVATNASVSGQAAGSGNVINQYLINHTNTEQHVIYTIVPTSTVAGSCAGKPFTLTVTVPVCPGMKITKSTSFVVDVTKAGDVIPYKIEVTNTANADQTNVVVKDPFISASPLTVKTKNGGNQDNILNKGETWIYEGSYTVTQSDLDNNGKPLFNSGEITNTASVESTELPVPQTDKTTVKIKAISDYTVVKTSDVIEITKAGQVVPYAIKVENTGNTAISNIVVNDPMLTNIKLAAPVTPLGDLNNNSKLDHGEIWIFTGSHTVTQAEIDAHGNLTPGSGVLRNVVAVSGDKPDGDPVYPTPQPAEKIIPITATGSFTIRKNSTTTLINKVGQIVPYTITVANTGKVAIKDLAVTDPLLKSGAFTKADIYSGDINDDDILDVNETWTFKGAYTVKQADLDNNGNPVNLGSIDNTASVTGNLPNHTPLTGTSNKVIIPVDPFVAYTIEKKADQPEIKNVGQKVTYTIEVANIGDAAIINVVVNDPMLTLSAPNGDTNNDNKLDVGELWIYTGEYEVTQTDLDNNGNNPGQVGVLYNAASVSGDKPNRDPLLPAESIKRIPLNTTTDFILDKTADLTEVTKAGETVTYTITVKNIGTTAISDVVLSDPMLTGTITGPIGDLGTSNVLDVNETWEYKGTYVVSQNDINNQGNYCADGKLSNTANVTGRKPDGTSAGSKTVIRDLLINPTANIDIHKTSDVKTVSKAGDLIKYEVEVENTGAVAINSIVVTDPMVNLVYLSGDINTDGKLDLNERWIYTGTYVVTQQDIDNNGNGTDGKLLNKATANGRKPDGTLLTDVEDENEVDVKSSAGIAIVKSSSITIITKAGQEVPYTITVTNTGTVAIADVEVSDPMLSVNPLVLTNGDANNNSKLDVNETWTYAAKYVVTQTDIDNFGNGITKGMLVNVATVSGTSPNGPITLQPSNPVITPIQAISAYSIEKTSTETAVTAAGQQIPYTISVKNTGNTAIKNVVVNDPLLSATPLILSSGDGNANDKLDVTEIWVYNNTYTVKQSDIDQNGNTISKGVLSNTATVIGTAPNDSPLDILSGTRVIPINTSSSFDINKTSDQAAVSKKGDVINYTITVTNTGKTAISDVEVNDPLLGGIMPTVASGDTNSNSILDIAEVWTYKGSYTLTQNDVNNNGNSLANGDVTANGNIINIVTVTGNKPDGSSAGIKTDINKVSISSLASFTLNKTSDVNEVTKAGDRVVYTVTAVNDGDVAIHHFVVTDPMVSLIYQSGDLNTDGKLDLNESWIYTGTYTVTQSDIDNQGNGVTIGKLVNTVTANGRKPDGSLIPEKSTNHTLDINATAAMTVKKSSATRLITRAGQVVTYAITVANTGTVAISDVVVNDPLLSSTILYSGDVNGNGIMDVRETWTFTGTYTVTQADIDNFGKPALNSGTLVNTATASGKLPNAAPINGTSNTVIIPIQTNAAYSIVKASTTEEITQAGQQVPYTITVKNTGRAAISNVLIKEPMMSVALISGDVNANNKLDVNETWIYTGNYIVKQSDIDNNGNTTVKGVLSNTASLTGNKPDGTALDELSSTKVIPLNSSSLFTVTKTADKLLVNKAGEVINYFITVSNAGVTAISDVKVNDPLLGGIIAVPTSGDINDNHVLDVAEAWIYTGSYTVSQADIDRNGNSFAANHVYANGNILNIVNVTGNKPDGKPAGSVTAVNEVPIKPVPVFSLTKTSDVSKVSKAGDMVTYTIVAENTGSVVINNFVVIDEMIALGLPTGDVNNNSLFDVKETWTYKGTYIVTQSDIDNQGNGITTGKLVNKVTANGRKPDGTVTSTVTATANVDIEPLSLMKIVKSSTTTVVDHAGQVVPYSITVQNSGTVAIGNVVVADPMLTNLVYNNGDVNGNSKLDVNETWTYTGTYTVSQLDIDNKGNTTTKGNLVNTATVTGLNPDGSVLGPVTSTKNIPVAQTISVDFTKVATGQVGYKAGETVTYEIKVYNTGNTTLKDVVVTDDNAAITNGSPIVQLNPGQIVLVTAVHTLTQPEVDAGKVINQAKLSGKDPEGNPVNKDSDDPSTKTPNDPTITQIVSPGSITLVKTAVLSGDGNTINYSFTVKNTGIVTLSNVVISDTKIVGPIAVNPSTLAPGEVGTASAVYTITTIEKTVGQVSNTAIVTGTSPNGFKVNDVSGTNEDNNTPTLVILPKITGTKSVSDANGNGIIEAGEELIYTITITNDGEVARTGVNVSDPIPAYTSFVNGSESNGGVLSANTVNWNNLTIPANGRVMVSFKVRVDAVLPLDLINIKNMASIINPAQPDQPIVVETDLPTEGKLESTKAVNDQKGNKDGLVQANEIITYTIEVKNRGGSTLTGIKINDVIPAGLTYVDASASNGGSFATNTLTWSVDLSPDASVILTFDAVAAADVNGITEIENVANILSPTGQVLDPAIKINVDPSADLVITKDLLTPAPIQTGDRIAYQIKVVNTGQNKATGVKVTDVLPGTLATPFDIVVSKGSSNYTTNDKTLGWTIGDLDLNETVTITFKTRVVATGSLVNTASVTADQPDPVIDNNKASSIASYVGGEDLLIPNLFTPNGDGNNDTFEIIGLDQFAENDLVIVNRWGNEVFRTKMYQNNWTGEGLNEGTYYYVLRIKKTGSAEWKVFKGYITLIRAFKK